MHVPRLSRCLFSIVLCAIATGCFPYHATTRMGFSGTVVDAETRAPLAGASVSFVFTTNGSPVAISAADGSFAVPRERKWQIRFIIGDYFTDRTMGETISIHHEGYEIYATAIVPIAKDQRFHTKTAPGTIPLTPLSKTH